MEHLRTVHTTLLLSWIPLNRAIDQLPKRLTMVIKAKGDHVEFSQYVLMIILVLLYFELIDN